MRRGAAHKPTHCVAVQTYAFVQPCYDLRDLDDLIPCEHHCCVAYEVWEWNPTRRGGWRRSTYDGDEKEEAFAFARKRHLAIAKKLGVWP